MAANRNAALEIFTSCGHRISLRFALEESFEVV